MFAFRSYLKVNEKKVNKILMPRAWHHKDGRIFPC